LGSLLTADFPPTDWSVIRSLREADAESARRGLAALCEVYWPPLYAFARNQGMDRESAEDLTQGFFLHLLQRETFAKADPSKGRLRYFLLGAFRHYLSNEKGRESAKKRSPERPFIRMDTESVERWYRQQPGAQLTPDEIFEQNWAHVVAGRAWKRLQAHQTKSGQGNRFERLQAYLRGGESNVRYGETASALGMSVAAVKVAVHRLRQEFGKWLRAEVRPTLAASSEEDDEVRHILRLLEASHLGIDGPTSA